MPDAWDDEQLLAMLKEALRASAAVPPEFIEAGKNAYTWRNIDAELARLTYDSTHDQAGALALRSETASIRSLTFTSAHLTIELEVTGSSLIGQAIPTQAGTIEIQIRGGASAAIPVDEVGCFRVRPIPDSPFRLHYRTSGGPDVLTGWITL
jgi:hypothetical protein